MAEFHVIMQARQMGKSEAQRRAEREREAEAILMESCAAYFEKRIVPGFFGWALFPFTNTELSFRAQSYREKAARLRGKKL